MTAIHDHLLISAGSHEAASEHITKAALQGILLNPTLMHLVSISDLLDLGESFTAGYFTLPTLMPPSRAATTAPVYSRRFGSGLGTGSSDEEQAGNTRQQLPTFPPALPSTRPSTPAPNALGNMGPAPLPTPRPNTPAPNALGNMGHAPFGQTEPAGATGPAPAQAQAQAQAQGPTTDLSAHLQEINSIIIV
jgi:hypothetical protein